MGSNQTKSRTATSNNDNIFQAAREHCPLCHSARLDFYTLIQHFEPHFRIDQCLDCGHLFMNPQWTSSYNESLYQKEYFAGEAAYHYHDERSTSYYDAYVWRARLKRIRQFQKRGHLLDIGCAFGGFLQEAAKYFIPYGVEPSDYAADWLNERFHNVHPGPLETAPWPDESMDVITAIEVIEHIPEPQTFLENIGRLLKPGGLVVIQTADFHGWQAVKQGGDYHYFLPGHLHYYHLKNLKAILRRWANIQLFYEFRGADVDIWPKMLKARGNFRSIKDYSKWFKIALYHILSKIRWRGRYLTSGFVLYGVKASE